MGALPNIPPQMIQGLGNLATTPLARAAVRYWWATVPIGYVAYTRFQERKKKGDVTLGGVLSDVAPILGLVSTLLLLNQMFETREAKAAANPLAPTGPVTDASFTAASPTPRIGTP